MRLSRVATAPIDRLTRIGFPRELAQVGALVAIWVVAGVVARLLV